MPTPTQRGANHCRETSAPRSWGPAPTTSLQMSQTDRVRRPTGFAKTRRPPRQRQTGLKQQDIPTRIHTKVRVQHRTRETAQDQEEQDNTPQDGLPEQKVSYQAVAPRPGAIAASQPLPVCGCASTATRLVRFQTLARPLRGPGAAGWTRCAAPAHWQSEDRERLGEVARLGEGMIYGRLPPPPPPLPLLHPLQTCAAGAPAPVQRPHPVTPENWRRHGNQRPGDDARLRNLPRRAETGLRAQATHVHGRHGRRRGRGRPEYGLADWLVAGPCRHHSDLEHTRRLGADHEQSLSCAGYRAHGRIPDGATRFAAARPLVGRGRPLRPSTDLGTRSTQGRYRAWRALACSAL